MRPQVEPDEPEARFLLQDHEPACLALYRAGGLPERVAAALRELEDCCACPRNCRCNRMKGETRACHTGRYAVVSSAFADFGEEDCLRGWSGSGTIFFGLCNLRCSFCQNWDISEKLAGKECGPREIADLMLGLQERGCHNVNFVTPEHAPQVTAGGQSRLRSASSRPWMRRARAEVSAQDTGEMAGDSAARVSDASALQLGRAPQSRSG